MGLPLKKTILKIEGPPGSGKTRELTREACRLIVEEGILPEQILFLALTPQNQETLQHFLNLEAQLAGLSEVPCTVQTLNAFWLQCLQWAGESTPRLLSDDETDWLLDGLLRRSPVVEGMNLGATCVLSRNIGPLFDALQKEQVTPERLSDVVFKTGNGQSWLVTLYSNWLQLAEQSNWMTQGQLLRRLSACDATKLSAELTARYRVILADEVQDWPDVQHQLLAQIPLPFVLAGHAGFSIRSAWGANPEAFDTLTAYGDRAITFITKQACMRGLEPALSLLNRFLPKPVWEEQMPDTERLSQQIQFGYFSDPQQEADGMVSAMLDWVRQTQIEERPATFGDCVILLRSSRYLPYLENAFREQNIPFASALSDEDLKLQQGVYDVLRMFEALQKLNAQAVITGGKTSITLRRIGHLDSLEWLRQANRHTRRWLESQTESPLLNQWLIDAEPDETLLLQKILEADSSAPEYAKANQLVQWYQAYQPHQDLSALLFEMEITDSSKVWLHCKEQIQQWCEVYQTAFLEGLSISELLERYHTLWRLPETGMKQPQVRIRSFYAMQGQEAPFVAIPFMVADELPARRGGVELLPDPAMEALGVSEFSLHDEEARLLGVGVSRASHTLLITAHQSDQGDREAPVLPSTFYVSLLNAKRVLLGQSALYEICQCKNNICDLYFCGLKPSISIDEPFLNRYVGESAWAQFLPELEEPLFDSEHVLSLSASAIHTYMTCPRQFYYRHLLKLPQPDSDAATLGTVIHRVMEVFNRTANSAPYTAERLRMLAKTFFQFEEEPEAFASAGFTTRDYKTLSQLGALTLSELKQRLLDSIDDLEHKGYFADYMDCKTIHAEKALANIAIEGIDRCQFSGKMDVVIQRNDGTWDIVDYKTYRRAYGTGLDTCDKHFAATLNPLPDDPELTPAERFSEKLNVSYPKDYQLPLYYLACAQNPEYRDGLHSVALQMIRPAFIENPNQGAIRLALSTTVIEAAKEKIVSDINDYIVQPILATSTFAAEPATGCGFCSYVSICDVGDEADLEEDA